MSGFIDYQTTTDFRLQLSDELAEANHRLSMLDTKERTKTMDACVGAPKSATDSEHIVEMLEKVTARMDDFGDRLEKRLAPFSMVKIDTQAVPSPNRTPAPPRPTPTNSLIGTEMFVRLNNMMDIISNYNEIVERFQM